VVHYNGASKVALQRFRDGAIREGQHTNIPDQGIRFDPEGFPFEEVHPSGEPSHTLTSRPSQQGQGGRDEPPGCGGPRGNGDGGDGEDSPSSGSDSDDEDTPPPSDEEDDIKELSLLRPNSQPQSRSRMNSGSTPLRETPSMGAPTDTQSHHQGYIGELNSY
jgi:hypothetical protein